MNRCDPFKLIVYFTINKERRKYLDTSNCVVDVARVLQIAEENKVSYLILNELTRSGLQLSTAEKQVLQEKIRLADLKLREFSETLAFVSSAFGENGIDFLIVKTCKGLPYITQDIDVLVRANDFGSAVRILSQQGSSRVRISTGNDMVRSLVKRPEETFQKPGLLKIDLYRDFSWLGMPCMDDSFIWSNTRFVDAYGVRCPIPNPEADLLSLIAHAVFAHGQIPLLDILYTEEILKSIRKSDLLEQSKRYGWGEALSSILASIQEFSTYFEDVDGKMPSLVLPLYIPLKTIVDAYYGCISKSVSMSNWVSALQTIGNASFQIAMMLRYRKWA